MSAPAEILGDSAGIRRLREQFERILKRAVTARRPPAILLRGETGCGKGLVARTLHRNGPRATAPFVDVNCAAIPETLLEAELFGYERGAFTGANQAKPGLFQLAHRGMLFLDEIAMLSPALQAKLLKVLEDGVVRRLGGTRSEAVDVWIVSATNEDLAEAMRARRFREDLYHRLAVLSLDLPPLRDRGADIILLAERFLARACADYGLSPKTFARDALAALAAYAWPGNVRELGNVVERVVLLGEESVITAAMLALPAPLPPPVKHPVGEPSAAESSLDTSSDRVRAHLLEVLTETGWNISRTAVRLGVARNTVLTRMARFGLDNSTAGGAVRPRPGGRPRRGAPAVAPIQVSVPHPVSSAAWEQRRVALLRVDVLARAGSAVVSRALDEMIGKVHAFEGEIVELGRGAFVAGFGLNVVEDAPVRAALAALVILKVSERAKSDDGAALRATIAVHVAQAFVTNAQGTVAIDVGSKRSAWTTIDALVGLEQFDAVVVSEAAAPFLERRFELTPPTQAGSVPFRCLTRRERSGFGLGGRPLSRFVGRDGELRLVSDRVAEAARGRGQLVGIVGEPGVGKSRFAYELTRIAATHDWRMLRCGGVSHGSTTPFLAIADLLRRYFAIDDTDEPAAMREKVRDIIASRHQDLTASLTPLLSLLDMVVDDPEWSHLAPPQQRRRIHDVVKRLLFGESRVQPLLVIVEDLQWIDTSTQALLDTLVESLPTARLLLLVNYRPEYRHRWASKSYYTQLRLDALAPESASELVHALLGEGPALEPLARLLVERGNPFVIEECVQTLVETGTLVGERGAYRGAQPIQTIELPATVQTLLGSRIERLSADDKALLQVASVIGKDVSFVLLQAVAELGEDELHRRLTRLHAREFLYETRLAPEAESEYTFKHALTHEATYGTVLPDSRTTLHARIVGAIERIYPDRLTEHLERLAYHAERGELWEQAVTYWYRAGQRALQHSAYAEGTAHLRQGLAVLTTLPETSAHLHQELDLQVALGAALMATHGYGSSELERTYARAEELCQQVGETSQLFQVLRALSLYYLTRGMAHRAYDVSSLLLRHAEAQPDPAPRLVAHHSMGMVLCFRGEHAEARTQHMHALELHRSANRQALERSYGTDLGVLSHCWLAWEQWSLGFPDQAAQESLIARALAQQGAQPWCVWMTSFWSAVLHQWRRDATIVSELMGPVMKLGAEQGFTLWSAWGKLVQGWALAAQGQGEQGVATICEGLAAELATGSRSWQPYGLGLLAEAHAHAGDPGEGLAALAKARAALQTMEVRFYAAEIYRLEGALLLRQAAPDAAHAEECFQQALEVARGQRAKSWELRAAMSLARLWRDQGKHAEARGLLAPIYDWFTEGLDTVDLREAKTLLSS